MENGAILAQAPIALPRRFAEILRPVCISAYNEKPFLSTHLSARIHIMYLNFPIGCGII